MVSDRVNVFELARELDTNLGGLRRKASALGLAGKMIDMSYSTDEAETLRQAFISERAAKLTGDDLQATYEYVQLNVKVPDTVIIKLKRVEADVYTLKMKQGKRAYATRAEILDMALDALARELAHPAESTA